jgi:hypothetical protein
MINDKVRERFLYAQDNKIELATVRAVIALFTGKLRFTKKMKNEKKWWAGVESV